MHIPKLKKIDKNRPSLIKRIAKIFLKTIIGIVVIIAILLIATFVIHRINLSREADKIEDYGQKIKIFDGTMQIRSYYSRDLERQAQDWILNH